MYGENESSLIVRFGQTEDSDQSHCYFKLLTNQALIIKTAILSHCLKVNLKMKKKKEKEN